MNIVDTISPSEPQQRKHRLFGRTAWLLAMIVCSLLSFHTFSLDAYGQGKGIPAQGTDFFVGYVPGLIPGGFSNSNSIEYWALIGSYTKNDVKIYYFTDQGQEYLAKTLHFSGPDVQQVAVNKVALAPKRPGEIPEYRAAHVVSDYPINIQMYSEGSINGGMYLAIPTPALGKSYVAACYNDKTSDNFGSGGFGGHLHDSSSGYFLVIAPFNGTTVTFVPTSTTYAGIVGTSAGVGATGAPHPHTIVLNKGQVYF